MGGKKHLSGQNPPFAHLLAPLVDQYRNSSLAVVGCSAQGIERPCCEIDALVVGDEVRPPTTISLGEKMVDIIFETEKDVLQPKSPEISLSVARARTVRDTSLTLSAATSAAAAMFDASAKRSVQRRLSSAVKALGRSDEALGKRSPLDAEFWLMEASYDYAYAWLYSKEIIASPSHLLQQLRGASEGASKSFEAFSKGAGLERGSREACSLRLEGVLILHDLLKSRGSASPDDASSSADSTLEVIKQKAGYLASSIEHAECFSYLGLELLSVVDTVAGSVNTGESNSDALVMSNLTVGKDRVLGERLVRELGFGRTQPRIESGLRSLKDRVSRLAKVL